MKRLGLMGGMSWESTIPYYRLINQTVKAELGGLHSAELILWSVDFEPIERLQSAGDWHAAGEQLAEIARRLEAAGAQGLVICTNTMHKLAPQVEAAVKIPLLHIVDATGTALRQSSVARIGLLGTRFTMEQDFYRGRLAERFGIESIVPPEAQRELVHRVIYDELCQGKVEPSSREAYRQVIADLVAAGAQAIVLGCTEIALLVAQEDSSVPLFDTTEIHARYAARWALKAN